MEAVRLEGKLLKTINIGKLCYIVRRKRDISQEKLIYGICNQSAYSNFEQDETDLPKNVIERLIQRLGLSSSDFVFLISLKEFEYQEWKNEIIKLIKEGNNKKALDVLQSRDKEDEDNIQYQFRLFAQGYLTDDLDMIKQSLLKTLPKINQISFRDMFISADEMKIILFYWEKEGRLLDKPEVIKSCIEYTDLYYDDQEKLKLLPYELDLLKQMNLDINDKLFVQYFDSRIDDLVKKYQIDNVCSLDFKVETNFLLISEYIKKQRQKRGMTQAEISEGICSVVTYSRFETGKQEMSRNSMQKIFHKLNLEAGCVLGPDDWTLNE